MSNRFEFQPHTLPKEQIRDLELMRDKGPVVEYPEGTRDVKQPPFEPAPSPRWHREPAKLPKLGRE